MVSLAMRYDLEIDFGFEEAEDGLPCPDYIIY